MPHVQIDRARLKHDTQAPPNGCTVLCVCGSENPDFPGVLREQAGHDLEQGRLACAVWTEQPDISARVDPQIDAIQRGNRSIAFDHV